MTRPQPNPPQLRAGETAQVPTRLLDPAARAAAGFLLALTFALYGGTLGHEFLIDDPLVITKDTRVLEGRFLDLVTGSYWPEGTTDRLYRPLVSVSYAMTWAVSQSPWAFRLPNLLLHVVACLLVFLLTREVFRSAWAAGVAAVLFAVHPLHTEPLNAVVGRADLAAFVFLMGAALVWWRDGDPGEPPRRHRPLLATGLFAAGVLCKESALTLVGVVVLLDFWRWWRSGAAEGGPFPTVPARLVTPARLMRCHGPMLVVAAGYVVLRFALLGQLTSSEAIPRALNPINTAAELLGPGESPGLVRWGTPLATFAEACRLMIAPWPLSHDYSYDAIPEVRTWGDLRLWFGLAWLAAVGLGCAWSLRRGGAVCVAIGLGVVQYALVSNVPVVIGTIFGERLLYAPSAGFCMLVGLLLAEPLRTAVASIHGPGTARKAPAMPVAAAAVVALLICLALVLVRNGHWSSGERLLASIAPQGRVSYKILNSYAEQEMRNGDRALQVGQDAREALGHFRQMIEYAEQAKLRAPENWVAYERIGVGHFQIELLEASLPALRDEANDLELAVLSLKEAVARGAQDDPRTLEYLGQIHQARGELAEAIAAQERLIAVLPTYALGVSNLAEMLLLAPPPLRDAARAEALARKGAALDPADPRTQTTLVRALAARGLRQEALTVARALLGRTSGGMRGEVEALITQLEAMP